MGEADIIADTEMADNPPELVCRMYALPETKDINEARHKKLLCMTWKYNQVNHSMAHHAMELNKNSVSHINS